MLEHTLRERPAFACGLHVADVACGGEHAQRLACIASLCDQRVQLEETPSAVSSQHPALGSAVQRAIGAQSLESSLNVGDVVAVNQRPERLECVAERLRSVTEQSEPTWRKLDAAQPQIPFTDADLRCIERKLPPPFVGREFAGQCGGQQRHGEQTANIADQQRHAVAAIGVLEGAQPVESREHRASGQQQGSRRCSEQAAPCGERAQQQMRHEEKRRLDEKLVAGKRRSQEGTAQRSEHQHRGFKPAPTGKGLSDRRSRQGQQWNADHQRTHRIAQPPEEPGSRRITPGHGVVCREPEGAVGGGDQHRRGHAEGREEPEVATPIELGVQALALQHPGAQYWPERVAARDREGHPERHADRQPHGERSRRNTGPKVGTEAQQCGQCDARWRPDQGDVGVEVRRRQSDSGSRKIRECEQGEPYPPSAGASRRRDRTGEWKVSEIRHSGHTAKCA